MPSSNAFALPPSTARFQLSAVNRPSGQDGRPERASRAEGSLCGGNPFRITYICKNAPANPYGSHISKTKDLKSFRITYFQKKGTGGGVRAIGARQEDGRSVRVKSPITNHKSRITGRRPGLIRHGPRATAHEPLIHSPASCREHPWTTTNAAPDSL